MVELNEYPPGVPCRVDTLQPDVEGAMRFYGDLMAGRSRAPAKCRTFRRAAITPSDSASHRRRRPSSRDSETGSAARGVRPRSN